MQSPPTSPHARRKRPPHRQHGRLGIQPNAQSPTALPPLLSPKYRGPRLLQQQHEERATIARQCRERLLANMRLVDLTRHSEAVERVLLEVSTSPEDDDCFAATKRLLRAVQQAAPYLGQFLLDLVGKIEQLAHDKLQIEGKWLEAHNLTVSPRLAPPTASMSEDADTPDSDASSAATSDEEIGDGEDEDSEGDGSSSVDVRSDHVQSPTADAPTSSRAKSLPQGTQFRTTLRSRRFPPTKVPLSEYIVTTSSYTPFEHTKNNKPDLSSLQLHGRDENGSAQWRITLFPKKRPRLCREELEAFMQWARAKQAAFEQDDEASMVPASTADPMPFGPSERRFRAMFALKELVCYELCRLIFDKCPTTARFILGLFSELGAVAFRALAQAERDALILEQRHKNVHLELGRLQERLAKVQTSLALLKDTLARRQQMLLHERERIIRKRKKLNLLLCADQVLLRHTTALIHHALELADDLTPATNPSPPIVAGVVHERYSAVDELVQFILDKYGGLPEVQRFWQNWRSRTDDDSDWNGSDQLLLLDAAGVQTAIDEFKGAASRLSRMVAAKSPDSSIGWDPEELWDQALFIPPQEDIQDLERDIRVLITRVERDIVRQRQLGPPPTRTVAVQTDLSACVPSSTAAAAAAAAAAARHRSLAFYSSLRLGWRGGNTRRGLIGRGPPTNEQEEREADVAYRWRHRHRPRPRRAVASHTPSMASTTTITATDAPSSLSPLALTGVFADDQRELIEHIVPDGLRFVLLSVPADYRPHQLGLQDVHVIISFVLNGTWLLLQEDFHRPRGFTTHAASAAARIPVATAHEYLHRLFLEHFRAPGVVSARLLDLLVSLSRLDTQSTKIALFCRLLGLPGVAGLPQDGFWFVLKALHVLQRCCASTGHYFLLDAEGEGEFVPQASASEAIGQLFAGASGEVVKRMRLKLAGLASVYGAVWIPAYNVLAFILEEWQVLQEATRKSIEDRLLLGPGPAPASATIATFDEFVRGFALLQLRVNRVEAVHAYRQLLRETTHQSPSRTPPSASAAAVAAAPAAPGSSSVVTSALDVDVFHAKWVQLLLHTLNVAQQGLVHPATASMGTGGGGNSGSGSGSGGGGAHAPVASGVHFGAISEAMASAQQGLSAKFLACSWTILRPEVVSRLNAKFHDVGLQVRVVQLMDAVVGHPESAAGGVGWRRLQQLIAITTVPGPTARP